MPPWKGMEPSWSLLSYLLTHRIFTPDPSPAWPWGPASRLFMRGAGPGITVVPMGEGGTTDGGGAMLTSLRQVGKGRREPRAGACWDLAPCWDLALLLPRGPLCSYFPQSRHLSQAPLTHLTNDLVPGAVQTPMDSVGTPGVCKVSGVPWEAGATATISLSLF